MNSSQVSTSTPKPGSHDLFGVDYDKITKETPTFIASQRRQKTEEKKDDNSSGESSSLQTSDLMSGRTKASFVRKRDGKGFSVSGGTPKQSSTGGETRTVRGGMVHTDTSQPPPTAATSRTARSTAPKKTDLQTDAGSKSVKEEDRGFEESDEEDGDGTKKKKDDDRLKDVDVDLAPEEKILARRRRERLIEIQKKLTANKKVDPTDTKRHGLVCKLRNGHNLAVMRCQYARDGNHILTGSFDRKAIVWDIKHQKLKRVYRGHNDMVFDAQFSPDRKNAMVATASSDSTCKVWDKKTGKCRVTLSGEHRFAIYTLAWAPDAKLLATAGEDRAIVVWNLELILEAKAKERRQKREAEGAEAAEDDDMILDEDFVKNKMFGSPSNVHGHTGPIRRIVFLHKGTHVLSCGDDSTIKFWKLNVSRGGGGTVEKTLTSHTSAVLDMALNKDETRLASASRDGSVRIWWTRSGVCSRTLWGHQGGVYTVIFTPEENGRRIISGGHDLSCIVWETETGIPLQRMLNIHRSYILSLSVRHDGLQFASASGDRTIGVWRALAPTRWDRFRDGVQNAATSLVQSISDSLGVAREG